MIEVEHDFVCESSATTFGMTTNYVISLVFIERCSNTRNIVRIEKRAPIQKHVTSQILYSFWV